MAVALVYLHNALPHLTMMPRVNVDEPWLMERAYQVIKTGVPSQPMLGLKTAYLLQVGYGYLLAPWMAAFGVGLFQARLFNVLLGLGIVLLVALIGRRTIDPVAGLSAAVLLAVDSNFLGGVRNARTDIPSVFFVTAALAANVIGRQRSRGPWFALSGASLGIAMLVHGNAFWAGLILFAWYLLDYGIAGIVTSFGYWFLGGLLLTFGPYLAVVLMRWHDVQVQIGNFAGDRVPAWRPSAILQGAALEIGRYRGWYFGLVTNTVPNPLLWMFKLATVAGILLLLIRVVIGPQRTAADPKGARRLLILSVGAAAIFACFINNKVPVYMPHLLIGFALAGGFAISEVSQFLPALEYVGSLVVAIYAVTGVVYYEKWYSSAGKSELVRYEDTTATLRALVPVSSQGRYIYASPQFWTPFHDEARHVVLFLRRRRSRSIATAAPCSRARATTSRSSCSSTNCSGCPELTTGVSQPTTSWQRDWVKFIEQRCVLDAVAFGTAHGTIAAFECGLRSAPQARPARMIGGATEFQVAAPVLSQSADELARWTKYDDPRRTSTAHPVVALTPDGVRISGTGWPGIVRMLDATPGDRYLVRAQTTMTHDGDLLYLGTWQQPQVRSLAGAASSGIPAPLIAQPWFPRDRAFIATAPQVRILVYSEAASTDFLISSLDVLRLRPRQEAAR